MMMMANANGDSCSSNFSFSNPDEFWSTLKSAECKPSFVNFQELLWSTVIWLAVEDDIHWILFNSKLIPDCFKLLNNWCQKKAGQLWAKKNGSLAAPQSANSRKSASRLRKFFFLQFNFTCREVHGLGHEIKLRPFSRSPVHTSDASGLAGQIFKGLKALAHLPRTRQSSYCANSQM